MTDLRTKTLEASLVMAKDWLEHYEEQDGELATFMAVHYRVYIARLTKELETR